MCFNDILVLTNVPPSKRGVRQYAHNFRRPGSKLQAGHMRAQVNKSMGVVYLTRCCCSGLFSPSFSTLQCRQSLLSMEEETTKMKISTLCEDMNSSSLPTKVIKMTFRSFCSVLSYFTNTVHEVENLRYTPVEVCGFIIITIGVQYEEEEEVEWARERGWESKNSAVLAQWVSMCASGWGVRSGHCHDKCESV